MKRKSPQSVIEVENLGKSYYSARMGRYAVLSDISLSIHRGEFVSLLGPSGGGKSTLLNILAGLEMPERGRLFINGRKPGAAPPIAYMQQKDLLLPWRTLWENIMLGPELGHRVDLEESREAARQFIRDFRLEGFTHSYPAQLSGGMRQRAALIRTLLCGQETLLLDEPFGALDAITRSRLHSHLLEVWRKMGKTVLLVTHDVEEAVLLSTRILLLSSRPGKITADIPVTIPHGERLESPETFRLKRQILGQLQQNGGDGGLN